MPLPSTPRCMVKESFKLGFTEVVDVPGVIPRVVVDRN